MPDVQIPTGAPPAPPKLTPEQLARLERILMLGKELKRSDADIRHYKQLWRGRLRAMHEHRSALQKEFDALIAADPVLP